MQGWLSRSAAGAHATRDPTHDDLWHDGAMPIELRSLPPERLREWIRVIEATFGSDPNESDEEAWARLTEPDRVHAAMDGQRIVGGGAANSLRLTIPGGEVSAAGVTAIGVLPTHRRQGMLSALMGRQLDEARERAEPVAILWASEGNIYQRYGYGLATLFAEFEIERERTAYRLPWTAEGQTRFITQDEALDCFPPVFERLRREQPGFYGRSRDWWDIEVLRDPEHRRAGATAKSYVLYEADGAAEGYAIYRRQNEWDSRGSRSRLTVQELMAATPRATRDLWRFVFDVDLIARTRASLLPVDHPLLLLLAEPRRLGLTLGDGLWLRIVDVRSALSARGYRGAGSVVFEVTDSFAPWNAGRWRLEADGSEVRVERTRSARDLAVDVADLAAAYLGAFGFDQLARSGRTTELRAGGLKRADGLFATDRAPWCPSTF